MLRFLATVALICCAASASAAPVVGAHRRRPDPTTPWSQFLHDAQHSSYDSDAGITAPTAPTLGINWMSALRSADLASPVVAYNATLGKTVVYIGDERGDVTAYDEAAGATLWSTSVGFDDAMRSSPMVAADGSLWVATAYGSTLYKLDGTSGNVLCSVKEPLRFNASPMFATPPGGVPMVYIATNDNAQTAGPVIGLRESDCTTLWSFTGYNLPTGVWATPAFGIDATGNGRVYFGTSDPDQTVYALDANTGALVWQFTPPVPGGDYDIGAGATVSPPGVNGFADGVLYVPDKYGIMFAVDLTTGAPIWQTTFDQPPSGLNSTGRSSAALDNTTLVFGMSNGVEALDATTGAFLWHYTDPAATEVISSPAIAGPSGQEVVAFGDTAGAFHVLRFADGTDLYDYQTGSYITASPAIVNGHILIDSTDGFLYDFDMQGGNVAGGQTAIATPKTGAKIRSPKGIANLSGSATDAAGVTAVQVAIQSGGPTGPWYDAATGTWISGAYNNFVAVQNPNAQSSTWTFSFPVPPSGSSYTVFANAVDAKGQVDRTGARTSFTVLPNRSLPQLHLSSARVAPGATLTVRATGFSPKESVAFSFDGAALGGATTNAKGAVNKFKVTVPVSAPFGLSALTATGQTSGLTTTAGVDISNDWTQFGYGAARSAFEPNDPVLSKVLEATGNGYVSRAWVFPSGAAIDASPAVVAGRAYVGNDAGMLSAVDIASGAPFWSYTTPTGMPIHGSPAAGSGRVVFGADDGTLYTLATATGAPLGSLLLDGIPTAPALAHGDIYVGTDNGTVYEIDAATGTVVWSTPVGAAIHTPPAVDTSANLVLVGDDNGNVTELNATTGAVGTSVTTGATVTAGPALSAGIAYVASSDGVLRSFAEATLALNWSFSAGAPIRTLSINAKGVYAGADSGWMYDVSARTGLVLYGLNFGSSPIVGMAASLDVPFLETAAGVVSAAKDDQQRIVYSYQTGAGLSTSPAFVDGTVYVGAEDGGLYAFTPYGNPPENAREQRFLTALRDTAGPARWAPSLGRRAAALPVRAFEPFGARDYPLHLDRPGDPPASVTTPHGGPTQRAPRTYVIAWSQTPNAGRATAAEAGAILRAGALPAGAAIDTAPAPKRLDDAAVRREIERVVVANHWKPDVNAQIVLVTTDVAASRTGYCDYHSAYHPAGNARAAAVYGFVPLPDRASTCGSLRSVLTRLQSELQSDPLLNARHDPLGRER